MSFFAIKLVALLWIPPKTLLKMCRICRTWNELFKRDEFWYRHRNYVLRKLPLLRAEFDYISDTSNGHRLPIWEVFAKRLWPFVRNDDAFVKSIFSIRSNIRNSVLYAGHLHPDRIAWIGGWGNIHYGDGVNVAHDIRRVSSTTIMNHHAYRNCLKFRKLTCSEREDFSYFTCHTIRRDSPPRTPVIARCITMYGPYKDIIRCNPKGVRFRDIHGHVDVNLRSNPLYPEDI